MRCTRVDHYQSRQDQQREDIKRDHLPQGLHRACPPILTLGRSLSSVSNAYIYPINTVANRRVRLDRKLATWQITLAAPHGCYHNIRRIAKVRAELGYLY